MISLLGDPLFTVRSAAIATLGSLHAAAVDALVAGRPEVPPGSPARIAIVHTLGNIAVALRETEDAGELRARGRARAALMDEVVDGDAGAAEKTGVAASRAAAISHLYRIGEPEMLGWIRSHLLDEHDPLIKRTVAWEESRIEAR
jgi:hypothetical protein